jgi:hypothetical protein
MRWLRLVLRILGWLLTPLVAWAASFCGSALAFYAVRRIDSPDEALYMSIFAAVVSGFGGLLLWMRLLRRSPRLRHSLHVTREGIPEPPVDLLAPPASSTESQATK